MGRRTWYVEFQLVEDCFVNSFLFFIRSYSKYLLLQNRICVASIILCLSDLMLLFPFFT